MTQHPASYRDPSGYVFMQEGTVYRFVHPRYASHYDALMSSGLYQWAVDKGLLLSHKEVSVPNAPAGAHRILKPEQVPVWTYPAEWSFEELRAAALTTLDLNIAALEKGLILKDATPLNIQFVRGRAVLIDTLSFEQHKEGTPWIGFRQFCTGFLYPLLLAHYLPRFPLSMLTSQPEGFSASLTAGMLPRKARFNLSNRLYVYWPASLEAKPQNASNKQVSVSTASIQRNLDHLRRRIASLQPAGGTTDWERYYQETILSDAYLRAKEAVIAKWLSEEKPASVLDLGCNTGAFSLLAATAGSTVTAVDFDAACIDRLFQHCRKEGITNITSLVADFCHPLAGGGWAGQEWKPLLERLAGHEAVFALALIHHLALAKNVPLPFIAKLLHQLTSKYVVVEWVPKDDPKSQELLRHREDIFDAYTQDHWEQALAPLFSTERTETVQGSSRILYYLRRK
jgi:SAM-dependent methyltransferase